MSLSNTPIESVFDPRSLDELDRIFTENTDDLTIVAGATDLMIDPHSWNQVGSIVNIAGVPDISQTLTFGESGVLVGAALPLSELIRHPEMNRRFPLIIDACQQIGSTQIQHRATLGGNIANASPAGDSLPLLAIYDADLWIGPRKNGEFRKKKLDEIMIGPGKTNLNHQYIAHIFLPYPAERDQFRYFRKVGQRNALAISKVSLAVIGWNDGSRIADIRIATGSVTPQIKRARQTEELLRGATLTDALIEQARRKIMDEITPISDIRSTTTYRRITCGALLTEALTQSRSL